MRRPQLPKARGVKLAVIFAAANAGAVLLVLSAGGGLEPILRPLLPSEDSSEVDVQVRAQPAIHPPVTDEVSAAARPDPANAKPKRQDRPVEPEADGERTSLAAPPPPTPPQPQPASPPSGKPAQPPPIEEPLPVIEEPADDGGVVQPPAVVELPPAEPPPEITKPVEDDSGAIVELDARGDDPNRDREDDQGQDQGGRGQGQGGRGQDQGGRGQDQDGEDDDR